MWLPYNGKPHAIIKYSQAGSALLNSKEGGTHVGRIRA